MLPVLSLAGVLFVDGFAVTLPRSPLPVLSPSGFLFPVVPSFLDGRPTLEEFAGEVRSPLVKFASPLITFLGASADTRSVLEALGL